MSESNAHVRVLVVVEDSPDMRMMVRAFLRREPRIEIGGEASNAQDAVELARSVSPGLIILDHMIEGDVMGLEAAPMLKQAAPLAKILLFSAFDMRKEAQASPAVDEFLGKAEIGQLLPTIRRMLDLN